jgi:hypothetical protein
MYSRNGACRAQRSACELADAAAPFVTASRIGRLQVVAPAPCVRIQKEQRRRLALQPFEQRDQREMLVDIGEVAGVKGVAIVHWR